MSSVSRAFESDDVVICGRRGNLSVGVVADTYYEQEDDSESSNDEDNKTDSTNDRLKPGDIRIEWFPSGREAVINENKIALLDRAFSAGEFVCSRQKTDEIAVVQNAHIEFDFVILPEKKWVLCGVTETRLKFLKEIDESSTSVYLYFRGVLHHTSVKLELKSDDDIHFSIITRDRNAEAVDIGDNTWKREKFCIFDAGQYYEGQPVRLSFDTLNGDVDIEWHGESIPNDNFKKRILKGGARQKRFVIQKAAMHCVQVNWISALPNCGNEASAGPPNNSVQGGDVEDLILLDNFPQQTAQIGDRITIRLNADDVCKLVPYSTWKKRFSVSSSTFAMATKTLNRQIHCQQPDELLSPQSDKNSASDSQESFVTAVEGDSEVMDDSKVDLNATCDQWEDQVASCSSSSESDTQDSTDDNSELGASSSVGGLARNMRTRFWRCRRFGKFRKTKGANQSRYKGIRDHKKQKKQPTDPSNVVPVEKELVGEILLMKTFLDIICPDGSVQEMVPAASLCYALTDLDDHIFYPGCFVQQYEVDSGGGGATGDRTGIWPPNGYGIISSVDHAQRLAEVYWFDIDAEDQDNLVAKLIRKDKCSAYDLIMHRDRKYNIGTIVFRVDHFAMPNQCYIGQIVQILPECGLLRVRWLSVPGGGAVEDVFPMHVICALPDEDDNDVPMDHFPDDAENHDMTSLSNVVGVVEYPEIVAWLNDQCTSDVTSRRQREGGDADAHHGVDETASDNSWETDSECSEEEVVSGEHHHSQEVTVEPVPEPCPLTGYRTRAIDETTKKDVVECLRLIMQMKLPQMMTDCIDVFHSLDALDQSTKLNSSEMDSSVALVLLSTVQLIIRLHSTLVMIGQLGRVLIGQHLFINKFTIFEGLDLMALLQPLKIWLSLLQTQGLDKRAVYTVENDSSVFAVELKALLPIILDRMTKIQSDFIADPNVFNHRTNDQCPSGTVEPPLPPSCAHLLEETCGPPSKDVSNTTTSSTPVSSLPLSSQSIPAITAAPITHERPWHSTVTQDLRNDLLCDLVNSIVLSSRPQTVNDHSVNKDLIQFATSVEKQILDISNDRHEYTRLLAEMKICKVQKELLQMRASLTNVQLDNTKTDHSPNNATSDVIAGGGDAIEQLIKSLHAEITTTLDTGNLTCSDLVDTNLTDQAELDDQLRTRVHSYNQFMVSTDHLLIRSGPAWTGLNRAEQVDSVTSVLKQFASSSSNWDTKLNQLGAKQVLLAINVCIALVLSVGAVNAFNCLVDSLKETLDIQDTLTVAVDGLSSVTASTFFGAIRSALQLFCNMSVSVIDELEDLIDPPLLDDSSDDIDDNNYAMAQSELPEVTIEYNERPSVTEIKDGFVILETAPSSHHYNNYQLSTSRMQLSRKFIRAARADWQILKDNLPSGMFVRAYEDRMDLFSVMIQGSSGTPFEHGLFLFDGFLNTDYPESPPLIFFKSFSSESLNPNLYLDGTVCVSLLGTWSGKDNESWTEKSNLLQLFVSIQGLILNDQPYFNEAGYEIRKQLPECIEKARRFNEQALLGTIESLARITHCLPFPFETEVKSHVRQNGPLLVEKVKSYFTGDKCEYPLQPVSEGLILAAKRPLVRLEAEIDKLGIV